MPRIAGVSSNSTVWCSRRKPRPRTVRRCGALHAIGLFTSVTRSFPFSAIALTRDLFDRLAALRGDLGGSARPLQDMARAPDPHVRAARAEARPQGACVAASPAPPPPPPGHILSLAPA